MEFLDLYHQLRYQTAMAIKKSSFSLGEFTYIETTDPNKDFVIGEDEGKIFVLSVDKDCVKFNKIEKCLGFDYLYNNFEFKEGISIGVLDIVLKIIKTFNGEKEAFDYILNEEIKQFEAKDYAKLLNKMDFENPYIEFANSLNDEDIEQIKMLSKNYQEVRNIIDRSLEDNRSLEDIYRDIESKFIELARSNNVELDLGDSKKLYDSEYLSEDEEHIEEEIKEPINVNSLLAKIRMKKVLNKKDEFIKFLKDRKGEINLWNGEIKANGILLDKFDEKNATILILDSQQIEINRNGLIKKILVKPSIIMISKDKESYQVLR
ncbi:hypothetical protein DFR86_03675 [Acidianus sulfidivorans JP7]|uniref:Uncharacterized protein n=1 Tax=Acidianus sulfidivorans JP7 TaxID=619593 RepID=A0A2U9IL37_9CREN|nr:hypothetical protein [Acidianus sulfidivorans]AWR96742.1 hypothetical protein DFR86_03675 [Acidianus sulfidivorans JP7]